MKRPPLSNRQRDVGPRPEHFCTRNVLGRPTRILDVGPAEGPVLLCSSGIASLLSDWAPLAERLTDGVRVLAFDRPGYAPGDDVPSSPLDLHEEADRLVAALTACGVSHPVTVAGHSFGAAIAEAAARLHPERVDRLVLLDGSVADEPSHPAASPHRITHQMARGCRRLALSAAGSHPVHLAWRVLGPPTFAAGAPTRLRHRPTREGLRTQAGSPTMTNAVLREVMDYPRAMRQLLTLRAAAPLGGKEVLVLAANGWRERTAPTAWVCSVLGQAEALEVEAHVTTVVLARSGHFVMLDRPRRVAELIAGVVR